MPQTIKGGVADTWQISEAASQGAVGRQATCPHPSTLNHRSSSVSC